MKKTLYNNEKITETITFEIDNLLALCKIFFDFEKFNKAYDEYLNAGFLAGKNKYNRFRNLIKILNKEKKFFNSSAKRFYHDNREIIKKINLYMPFSNFILINYSKNGQPEDNILSIYNYLKRNRNNLNNIVKNLEQLKHLGFTKINLNENFKFDSVYTFNKNENCFTFTDGNIEIIPAIDKLKYKSNGANYMIKIDSRFEFPLRHIPVITLNNLIFDKELLPIAFNYEQTLGKIQKLYQNDINVKKLNNIVNVNVCIKVIEYSLDDFKKRLINLEDNSLNAELLNVLFNMRKELEKIKTINRQYNEIVIASSKNITKQLVEKEEKIYKKKL